MEQSQIDIDLERLKDNLMIGADIETEEDLPFKIMQGIFVKEMQSRLIRNNNKEVIFSGNVKKQGQKANKKLSDRYFVLFPKEVMWFHSQKHFKECSNNNFRSNSNSVPDGVIRIEHIYDMSLTKIKEETFDFDISVSKYIKKGKPVNVVRTINFGCETELARNQWISRIEFLRAKSSYDNYVSRFANI
mmetsp:Transcript_37080/g.56889  ORF Transcript_37080/g.56889 Transcript_37080/m.56889 type:complete len:189 (+) Transcript_37080:3736-4302(+)